MKEESKLQESPTKEKQEKRNRIKNTLNANSTIKTIKTKLISWLIDEAGESPIEIDLTNLSYILWHELGNISPNQLPGELKTLVLEEKRIFAEKKEKGFNNSSPEIIPKLKPYSSIILEEAKRERLIRQTKKDIEKGERIRTIFGNIVLLKEEQKRHERMITNQLNQRRHSR